ncbi:MAG: bifunctional folylpolyglutamate synthase/dihydrofolate synthase [Candidatus Ancillula trichonymphae]|jgi:dihydrofolate synthase/folylpolyglutamate synthase|nr:bifunctional folylpolyglutamate synthase/dihydrofolate synthase [Candidatus Ancillula trichonymphae]
MKFKQIYSKILLRGAHYDQPKLSLLRIREVLHRLGDPDSSFKSVVIAGTNGKTSTARILESILRSFGFRTGLYTSPHLISITERISANGNPISKKQFVKIYKQIIPIVEEYEEELAENGEHAGTLNFFELLTVMAIFAFATENVHFAVVEVGLGGRFDATNVLSSSICIITPINYDHTQYLGSQLTQIAFEKAGIIKNADAVIVAKQVQAAEEVLLDEAERQEIYAVFLQNRDFEALDDSTVAQNSLGEIMNIRTTRGVYENLYLNLLGDYQVSNAALSILAAEELIAQDGCMLEYEPLKDALQGVTSPGRLQVLSFEPLIVVDVSHNPQGAKVMVNSFRATFEFDHIIGVVGILADKDAEKMFEFYEDLFNCVVVTKNSSERSCSAKQLQQLALKHFDSSDVHKKSNLKHAIDFALDLVDDMHDAKVAVLITGSVVTAGDALEYLQKSKNLKTC